MHTSYNGLVFLSSKQEMRVRIPPYAKIRNYKYKLFKSTNIKIKIKNECLLFFNLVCLKTFV